MQKLSNAVFTIFNFPRKIWFVLIQCKKITKFHVHEGTIATVEHTLIFLEVSLVRTCRGSMKSMKLICKVIYKHLKASAKVNPCQNNF